jgi:hypothetical protein
VNNKYILLKSKNGDVFWTIFRENESYKDFEILFQSSDQEEIIRQWRYHYVKNTIQSFDYFLSEESDNHEY